MEDEISRALQQGRLQCAAASANTLVAANGHGIQPKGG